MKFKSLLAWLSSIFVLSASPMKIGAELPKLEGKNQDGEMVSLKAADGDSWLLIFTYPKALTGG